MHTASDMDGFFGTTERLRVFEDRTLRICGFLGD
jgi:hypothetical protein